MWIKARFHLLDAIKHFFQLGIGLENEINAHRLNPCWSYTASGVNRNDLV